MAGGRRAGGEELSAPVMVAAAPPSAGDSEEGHSILSSSCPTTYVPHHDSHDAQGPQEPSSSSRHAIQQQTSESEDDTAAVAAAATAAYARHVAHNDPERGHLHLTAASAHFSATSSDEGGRTVGGGGGGGLSVSDLLNPSLPTMITGDGGGGNAAIREEEAESGQDRYCFGTTTAAAGPSSSTPPLNNARLFFQVDSDADSAMGDVDYPMSTASVRSSIYEYVEEYGRTFHRYKQGKYWMPNDKTEQERLDLQHAVFMYVLKGRFGLAPVKNPQAVLDIGTGTGIWAIEYAMEHPSAHVIGTDLSPIQPEYVPANCHFEVDDAEDDWIYGHPFDYVHLRLVFHAFKSHPRVMQLAFDNLQPGGWIEYQDYYCHLQSVDGTLAGTSLEKWTQLYVEGGLRLGRDMLAPRKYKHWLEQAGFVNVVEQKLAIPGNPWPKGDDMKTLGLWQMTNFLDGIHAVSMTIFTRGLGMSPEEVELLLVDVRKDIKNLGVHFYFLTYFVYGQKPFEEKAAVGVGGAGSSGSTTGTGQQ